MTTAPDMLAEILRPSRLTAVVDIGANPIDGEPPYKPMLAKKLCKVVGFEPQAEALAALNARKGELETYFPYAIGDGAKATLHVCGSPGMTSLFRLDMRVAKSFRRFEQLGRVVKEMPIETMRLDDVTEISELDFLKIDVQGAELSVFRHGVRRLKGAVAIQTEVSFVALYEGQPAFGDIDLELRRQGFIPHCFPAFKKWMISPLLVDNDPFAAINQLLEADIVYVRDFTQPERMETEQLKHLAMIAHHCYGSLDLAVNCIHHLIARGAVAQDSIPRYLAQATKR